METDVPDAEVTLRWGNVAGVQRWVNLRLVDVETGRRIWMRTAPAFTFRSGQGTARRQFAIEMDMDTHMPLRITSLKAQQTRSSGITVQFALSKPASVRVQVLSAGGKVLREVESATTRSAGFADGAVGRARRRWGRASHWGVPAGGQRSHGGTGA